MKIRYTRAALEDLFNIHAYIAEDNPTAADRVMSELRDTIKLLSSFPELGRRGTISDTREFVVSRLPYVIVYQISDTEIQILNLFHMARNRG